jgi:integrase/recombinase XerD
MQHPHARGGSVVVDLFDAASYHQLVLHTEGRSQATLRLYLTYQRRFLDYLSERGLGADLDALNPVNVRQAVLWLQKHGQGARGGEMAARMFVDVMRIWSNFLEREGVWEVSPLRRVRRMRVRRLERQPFSRTEVQALVQATSTSPFPERDRLLLLLLLDTGARIGEIMTLGLDGVSVTERHIRVLGKGLRERTVPFGDAQLADGGPTLRALRAYLRVRAELLARFPERGANQLLLDRRGYAVGRRAGTDIIRRLGDRAGVPNAIPHRCRHTFITQYLTVHVGDESGLRRLVGHISRDVLADYTHLSQLAITERQQRASIVSYLLGGQKSS